MFLQPDDHGLAVGRGGFPKTEQITNLGTMILDRAALPVVTPPVGRIESGLLRQMLNGGRRHFLGVIRKAALRLEELEQHRKTETGRAGLGKKQQPFLRRERPGLGQFLAAAGALHEQGCGKVIL